VDGSLSFMQEVKESRNESIEVSKINQLSIRRSSVQSNLCDCFKSCISGQIVCKSVVVYTDDFLYLLAVQNVVANTH
jgi:hypothetical protein